jgi:hypothetical protein
MASVNFVESFASETEECRVDWIEVRKDHEGYLGRDFVYIARCRFFGEGF